MKCGSERSSLGIVGLVALIVALVPLSAHAQTRIVNCDAHQTVTSALKLPSIHPLVVKIRGTCNEAVTIGRDAVTLIADSAGAGITQADPNQNTIVIDGAKNVKIDGLIVSGARSGIVGRNGAVFIVQNATVQNNAQNGIVAIFNSTVTVQNTVVTNNGKTGDKELGLSGIAITDSSAGTMIGSTITNNGHNETIPGLEDIRQPGRFGTGVTISRGSTGRIGRTSSGFVSANTITGNASSGISVYQTSHGQIWGNAITGNGSQGVYVEGGSATIVLNDISSNGGAGISVTNDGGARIGYDDSSIAMFRLDCSCTNKIVGNGQNGASDLRKLGAGIDISSGANATFHGNLIDSNTGNGVVINHATGRAAGGNIIRNSGDSGILVSAGHLFQGKFSILAVGRDQILNNGTNRRAEPGNDFGVTVAFGASAVMTDFLISGNRRDGIIVYDGSSAALRSVDPNSISVIEKNGTLANDGTPETGTGSAPFSSIGSGVLVVGASVEARGVIIRNNKVHGINVVTGGKAIVRAHVFSFGCPTNCYDVTLPTEISGNGASGVSAFNGSSVDITKGTLIHDNGTPGATATASVGNGISLSINSSANVTDSTIEHNAASGISLFANSSLSIGGSSTSFQPIGSYPNGLQSFVRNNGLDGITAFANSVVNMGKTSVTGNGRTGFNCGSQSRIQGDFRGVAGNHADPNITPAGVDLSGNVLTTTTVFDSPSNTTKTVVTTTPLASANNITSSFFSGSCF